AKIDIKESEIRIDTFRAGGAGGQHVNKTESAVRITHLPTGLVVQCQNERSQHRNRDAALKVLTARLYAMRLEEDREKLNSLGGGKKDIAWGNQIRSYVFQPYTQVKDHRTDVVATDVQSVMDGDLDPFIDAYLRLKEPK
ncbi:MAG TPA: peptide chain release factor-like protein, partial [Candidatus Eisenbacteria bacterium]